MGFLDSLFSSPREREAPGLYKGQLSGYDDILDAIKGLQNTEGGVNDIASLKSKFGLGGTSKPFEIAKRNLATQNAKNRAATSARMSSSVANPEAVFSPGESSYLSALGGIEQGQAEADIGQQNYMADLLDQILNRQNQFNMGKQTTRAGVLGQKGGAMSDYLGALSGASTFDDILAAANTASKFINPLPKVPKPGG
jgi:hypothetical protein